MALTAKKVYAILKRQISDMEAKLNSPVRYRGTVATADLLPLNPDIGDMYNIESKSIYGEAGMNVAWNGVVWDTMGAPIDMSLYLTKEEAERVIQRLVTEYFEKNPVKPGATTEQAQQIEQNKTDIASLKTETGSLKEDISNKITKFYASSQGESHLADSDNGKIMDMMVYGKSEQKQYSGKNLLNPTFETDTYSGVALTNNGDGTYTIEGTNNSSGELIFSLVRTVDEQKALYNSLIGKNVKFIVESGSTISGSVGRICFVFYNKTENRFSNETYNGGNVTVPTGYDSSVIDIHINVGQTVPKTILKPMIVDASLYPDATYDTFEPYTGGIPSPNPDYPQEIKSVVNPTVKVCGKNLWDNFKTLSSGNVEQKNGTYIATTDTMRVDVTPSSNGSRPLLLKANNTYTFSLKTTVSTSGNRYVCLRYTNGEIKNISFINNNFINFVPERDVEKIGFILYRSVAGDKVYDVQLEMGSEATPYEPYHEQTVTLPYTLNAIPVNSGGNVTIDGQQYIADYVDVERGKLVRMVDDVEAKNYTWNLYPNGNNMPRRFGMNDTIRFNMPADIRIMSSHFKQIAANTRTDLSTWFQTYYIAITDMNEKWKNSEALIQWFSENKVHFYLPLKTPTEIDLTSEEVQALKALTAYYPTTNISVNSEQLDGYTVFNYPISMENGWNYVKQQIGDTRDYIYDMDARTQDTDLQAAEAYVNSEYAVTLTELEV